MRHMNCSECQRIIDDVADMDRLPPEAARHAAACAACERFGDDLGRLRSLLREPERVTAPEGFDARRSATGRQMLAVRSNERAAAAAGVNVSGTKALAFGTSAAIILGGGAIMRFWGILD